MYIWIEVHKFVVYRDLVWTKADSVKADWVHFNPPTMEGNTIFPASPRLNVFLEVFLILFHFWIHPPMVQGHIWWRIVFSKSGNIFFRMFLHIVHINFGSSWQDSKSGCTVNASWNRAWSAIQEIRQNNVCLVTDLVKKWNSEVMEKSNTKWSTALPWHNTKVIRTKELLEPIKTERSSFTINQGQKFLRK